MDLRTEITALTALSTVAFLAGAALVLFFEGVWPVVGIVLLTVSGVVLVLDVTDVFAHWRQVSDE